MSPLIAEKRSQIEEACQKNGISRLWLFGSAAGHAEKFDAKSDIDFLVEIDRKEIPIRGFSDPFWQLSIQLDDLFDREVQLMEFHQRTDERLRRNIEAHRELIYDASRV